MIVPLVLLLALLSEVNATKTVSLQKNKVCVVDGDTEPTVTVMKGKNKQLVCKARCLNTESCQGFFFNGVEKKCYRYSDKVLQMKKAKGKDKDKMFCGIAKIITEPPTDAPTVTSAPTTSTPSLNPSPGHSKNFVWDFNTVCTGKPNPNRSVKYKKTFKTLDACIMKCGQTEKCKSFSWKESKEECVIYMYRITDIAVSDPKTGMKVCGKIPKPPNPPSAAPTTSPPTVPPPTKAPTPAPRCVLKGVLAFDFKDPDDAPYYGYHACYLEVTKDSDDYHICSHEYYDWLPGWCSYKNSDPEKGDSTYVENTEDYYYPDAAEALTSETVVVRKAGKETIRFSSYHYFFDEDYYTNYKGWEDHAMAPRLKIYNMSNKKQKRVGKPEGYSHPTDKKTSTHIKKKNGDWVINPKYKGNFEVTVTCTAKCNCKAKHRSWAGQVNRMSDGNSVRGPKGKVPTRRQDPNFSSRTN